MTEAEQKFYMFLGEEFRRQVKKVVEIGADKLIIDLRGNVGGLVTETRLYQCRCYFVM